MSEIRILKLLPSSEPDELHCSLETCSLDDKPFYVAVSYEWGESEPQVDIKINGKPFKIRHNLWLFLCYLHNNKSDHVRHDLFRLWVDAICIDQTNLTEKDTQVQIINQIFKKADSVVAWLGYTTQLNTEATFRFMKEASFHGQLSFSKSDDNYRHWGQDFMPDDAGSWHLYHGPLLEIWKRILQLSKLSYWSRRWIVQELLLPKEVTIVLDDKELPWNVITTVFDILARAKHRTRDEEVTQVLYELEQTVPWQIWSHRGQVGSAAENINALAPLLRSFRQTVCTVAHDKVYAFLGLIENGNSVKVDYACSMTDVFCRVASFEEFATLSATSISTLATELGLFSQLDEKHTAEAIGIGPFVKYSVKLSDLVRIVDTGLSWYSVRFLSDMNPALRKTFCFRHNRTIEDLVGSHQIFDTNLINSGVQHNLGETVCLTNKRDEMSESKDHDGILGLDRIRSSASSSSTKSHKWNYIASEDGDFGMSCSSTLPGDFLCPMGLQKWLVLRYYEGLFTIVGTAFKAIPKPRVRERIDSTSRHLDKEIKGQDRSTTFDISASSIEILFNIWELLKLAQNGTHLENFIRSIKKYG